MPNRRLGPNLSRWNLEWGSAIPTVTRRYSGARPVVCTGYGQGGFRHFCLQEAARQSSRLALQIKISLFIVAYGAFFKRLSYNEEISLAEPVIEGGVTNAE